MMVPAADGWRALFSYGGGVVARQVAFWCGTPDGLWGVVANEYGEIAAANNEPGFIGYAAPDDDWKAIVTALERREVENVASETQAEDQG